jgi:xanthine/uracil permease
MPLSLHCPFADLISAGLIICGICTMIQVTSIPLPFNRQIGAGILSVMGISFTTFAPANSTIASKSA